jgi:3-deoxy-manno-octulosonate cytidylyltransferase (CMP-KDO synthetase)
MKILGVIPARYASTRFPGKPLADVAGLSMIQRVYEQVEKSKSIHSTVVATDHKEVFDHVKLFGNVCMTSQHHPSGTDRCFEAMQLQKESYDYVINIQGDEPFIRPEQIDLLAGLLDSNTHIATLIKQIEDQEELFSPNVVKIVFDNQNAALYFSRSPIPHARNIPREKWLKERPYYKHLGMYAYRSDVLRKLTELPVSFLEKTESLEQLRWLENGFRIKVRETNLETIGIDTPEDLKRALAHLKSSS